MRPVLKRMTTFFLLVFLMTSIGDTWSTELGRQRQTAHELSPLGFQPLQIAVLLEMGVCVVGLALVACGAVLSFDILAAAPHMSFAEFRARCHARYFTFLLLWAPIAIAEIRILAVANNVSQLAWSWSPVTDYVLIPIGNRTGLSQFQSLCLMLAFVGMVAFYPVTWTIYCAARGGRLAQCAEVEKESEVE